MKFNRITLSLCLTLTSATVGLAQGGVQKSKPLSTPGTTAPETTLQARSSRAAVVRLESGESITGTFLRADEDTIEIETADERRKIKLDEVASITFSTRGANGSDPAASQRAKTPLLLLSQRCGREGRFMFVRGEVKNTSSKPFRNIAAVGTFRAKGGAVIKVEHNLIGEMLPGQTSSFDVVWWDNPRLESCEMTFKFFRGAVIPHTELTQW